MPKKTGMGRVTGFIACCAIALTAALGAAGAAWADESAWPTAQASAYNFAWVPYLDPPPKPAAICLVDSGIDITPDTPADSPAGPILERTSLDGGPGTGIDSDHGTYMAMQAGAPMNGWGTVGLWPGLRIVSVRALPQGQQTFPFDDYRRAISECRVARASYDVVVVNLSLDCNCGDSSDARQRLDNTIADAHAVGISVVASAGNNASSLGSPANESGVFSVGASDTTRGGLCSFSNRGPDLDLIAPGCGLAGAYPASGTPFTGWQGGTSAAAAQASSALALLRSYRPDVSWEDAEQLVMSSAQATPDGPRLDLDALFRAAGLDALVEPAKARALAAAAANPVPQRDRDSGASSDTAVSPIAPPATADRDFQFDAGGRYRAPRIKSIVRIRRRLTVSVRNRPSDARLVALVQRRVSEFGFAPLIKAQRATDKLAITLPRQGKAARLVLRYEVPKRPAKTSPPLYRRIG